MTRTELQKRLDVIGIPRNFYCLKNFDVPYGFLEGYVLEKTQIQWDIYHQNERGIKSNIKLHYLSEDDACIDFISKVSTSWERSKELWTHESELSKLLNYFRKWSFISYFSKRFPYKWRLYPCYEDFESLIKYLSNKYKNINIEWTGDRKLEIMMNRQTIIVHNQNGKWYVVQTFSKYIYGLEIVDDVKEVCLALFHFIFNEEDYLMYSY